MAKAELNELAKGFGNDFYNKKGLAKMAWSDATPEQQVKITKFFEFYVLGLDDDVLDKCVDDLWVTHAKGGSGGLDKSATKALVKEALAALTGGADL